VRPNDIPYRSFVNTKDMKFYNWKTRTGRQHFADIIGLSLTTAT